MIQNVRDTRSQFVFTITKKPTKIAEKSFFGRFQY